MKILNKYFFKLSIDEKEELFQVGCIELIRVIDRFDVNLNNSFSTYAIPSILGVMKKYKINDMYIKAPRKYIDIYSKILKNNLQNFSSKEIAEKLNIDEETIKQVIGCFSSPLSLEQEMFDEDGTTLENVIPSTINIEDEYLNKEEVSELFKYIELLSVAEQIVIKNSFGISCEVKAQTEVAKMLNISQPHVSRIRTAALLKLRKMFENNTSSNIDIKKTERIDDVKNQEVINTNIGRKKQFDELEEQILLNNQSIIQIIDSMKERNKELLYAYYGINGQKKLSVDEILKKFGYARRNSVYTQIRLLKNQINKKLQKNETNNISDIEELNYSSNNENVNEENTIEEVVPLTIRNNENDKNNVDFEKYRKHAEVLINMLDDMTEKTILTLRLGFVRGRYYTEEEISSFLKIEISDVHNIIQTALKNISNINNNSFDNLVKQLTL